MQTHSSVRRAWARWRMRVNVKPVHVHRSSRRRSPDDAFPRYGKSAPRRWAQGFDSPHA